MSSVEFRKDLFADERRDDLNEVGQPTVRQDILGHVSGTTRYYDDHHFCLLYTSPSPRDRTRSRMPSSA